MSKTFLRSLSASSLLLAGYHILMPYPVLHAARTLQTASLEQSSDAFLKGWLRQDVAYLVSDAEKAAYLSLASDAERYEFIERFWQQRDPSPGTTKNEFRDQHYWRIAYANERFHAADQAGEPIAGGSTSPGDRRTRSNRILRAKGSQVLSRSGGIEQARVHPSGPWSLRSLSQERITSCERNSIGPRRKCPSSEIRLCPSVFPAVDWSKTPRNRPLRSG